MIELRWIHTETPLCAASFAVSAGGLVKCSTLQYRHTSPSGFPEFEWQNVEVVEELK